MHDDCALCLAPQSRQSPHREQGQGSNGSAQHRGRSERTGLHGVSGDGGDAHQCEHVGDGGGRNDGLPGGAGRRIEGHTEEGSMTAYEWSRVGIVAVIFIVAAVRGVLAYRKERRSWPRKT